MKRNEQMILTGLVVIGLVVAFWLLILSPKRNEAATLQNQIGGLHSSLTQAQQEVAAGEQARKSFKVDYRRLVVLGKAVPADSDQTSLLVQLQGMAERSGVDFRSIDLSDAAGATAPAPVAPTSTTPTTTPTSSTDTSDPTASTSDTSTVTTEPTVAAPATEAAASLLPIGAAIGPAGLPVMPYDLEFEGGFFQIADFMERVDGMVHTRDGLVDVQGRLLTVDSFTLTTSDTGPPSEPNLIADLSVTTYLTPADQGVTAGATPTGPAPATPTLASSTTAPSTSSVPTDATATAVTSP